MSATAVIMMIVAMLVIWGGLALAVLNVMRADREEPRRTMRDL
ncbi:methionine/alanine import family NSS transporter small subunit [Nocardioides sp. GY 10113]|nr:methionine/alanine import family NSS transporter small subunit [Nocardioides sp. GY 10113]TIC81311.1 methionine/alanine import family NSS transporter small subunit [Nocardioides sp. GY 10113]